MRYFVVLMVMLLAGFSAATTNFNIIDSGVEISGSVDIWEPQYNFIDGDSYNITDLTSAADYASVGANGGVAPDEWSVSGSSNSSGCISVYDNALSISSTADADAHAYFFNPDSYDYPNVNADASSLSWVTFSFSGENQYIELYGEASSMVENGIPMPGFIDLWDMTISERVLFTEIPIDPDAMPHELESYKGTTILDTSHIYRLQTVASAGADAIGMMIMSEGNYANVFIVPEPATFSLLCGGSLLLRKRKNT